MRLIGVVDLRGGIAVHARGGARDGYLPVEMVAGARIAPGDPLALARAYVDRLGLTELYAADLDAIVDGAPQDGSIASLAALGTPLWVDAGVRSAGAARRLLDLGVERVIVGLETLPSYEALRAICDAVGGRRVAFSLDVRDGVPLVSGRGMPAGEPAERIAARAADAGAGAMVVLDLARVGMGTGPDVALIARVRSAAPDVTLLAGGGIRDEDDLARLAAVGCDGALVATALHDGRLGGHRSATR
jgi:phosphoribosylformimino-5-aminoimidazole carboxamide ribotide isomerase